VYEPHPRPAPWQWHRPGAAGRAGPAPASPVPSAPDPPQPPAAHGPNRGGQTRRWGSTYGADGGRLRPPEYARHTPRRRRAVPISAGSEACIMARSGQAASRPELSPRPRRTAAVRAVIDPSGRRQLRIWRRAPLQESGRLHGYSWLSRQGNVRFCRDEVRRDGTAHATGPGKEANLLLGAEPIVASARVARALLAHA